MGSGTSNQSPSHLANGPDDQSISILCQIFLFADCD